MVKNNVYGRVNKRGSGATCHEMNDLFEKIHKSFQNETFEVKS